MAQDRPQSAAFNLRKGQETQPSSSRLVSSSSDLTSTSQAETLTIVLLIVLFADDIDELGVS